MDLRRGFVVEYQPSGLQNTRVLWGKTLALKMGWIEQVSTDVYRLGPNLLQEFHSDTIPTPSDVLDADNKPAFWKVDGDYMVLSLSFSFVPRRNFLRRDLYTCIVM